MITKEQFTKLITAIQALNKEYDRWEDFGINLWDLPIGDRMAEISDLAIKPLFKDEGIDWINWWMYEKPALIEGESDNEAFDENGNIIPTNTIDDLWNIVEDYRK